MLWWFSFSEGEDFRGVSIVRGNDEIDAMVGCKDFISAGWTVVGGFFPPQWTCDPQYMNRLLSYEEAMLAKNTIGVPE